MKKNLFPRNKARALAGSPAGSLAGSLAGAPAGALAGALAVALAMVLVGCASTPSIAKGSSNYLQKGMTSASLKGNEFYMAVGDVDLYDYSLFGGLQPSGKTAEIAVVIQADKDTGEALKIATMQTNPDASSYGSTYANGAAVAPGSPYMLADLRGGISIIDVQPYPRWLDAVDAMKAAISKLSTYTNFGINGQGVLAPVIVPTIGVSIGPEFDFGWRWGFHDHWRHDHFHRWR